MDIRLVATAGALLLTLVGFVLLVLTGHTSEGNELLQLAGLPSLTFILGLGSDIKKSDK